MVIIHCTDAALHEQGLNQTPLSLCDLRDSMNTLEMPVTVLPWASTEAKGTAEAVTNSAVLLICFSLGAKKRN